MKKLTQIFIAGALALTATSCVKVNFEDPIANTGGTGANSDDPNTTRILKGSYERSITLTGGTYTIQGYVYFQQ